MGVSGRHRVGVQGFFWIVVTPSASLVSAAGDLCGWVMFQPVQTCLCLGFCPQASEGVPMRFFTKLDQLIEFYKKENMGLVTHLQYPVPLEEEDAGDEPEEDAGRKGWTEGRRLAAACGKRYLLEPSLPAPWRRSPGEFLSPQVLVD